MKQNLSSSAPLFVFQPSNQQVVPGAPVLSSQWVPLGTVTRPAAAVSAAAAPPTQAVTQNPEEKGVGLEAAELDGWRPPPPAERLSSQQGGVRSGAVTAAESEEVARRPRKRERPAGESVDDSRWALKRKLAALSQDVELLTQEVARVRHVADASCMNPMLSLEDKAILAEKHAKKKSDAQKRGISILLRDIMAHKFANPFLKPVDAKIYPEYPLKISNPMDFTTVKARLDAGAYINNFPGFLADVNLLFDNAFIYNLPGQPVHEWAVTLREKFDERMKGLNSRLELLEGEKVKEEEEALDIARRRLQDRAWEQLAVQRGRLEPHLAATEAKVKELRAEAAAGCGFVSLAGKHALMEALRELKSEDFEQAMQIIVNRHPGLLQTSDDDFLDVSFDPLDSLTLRQLSAFCNFCRKGQHPDSPNCWPGLIFGTGARGCAKTSSRETTSLQQHFPAHNLDGSHTSSRLDHATTQAPPPATAQAPGTCTGPDGPALVSAPGGLASTVESEETKTPLAVANKHILPLREVGERSWSILQTEASQRGKKRDLLRVISGSSLGSAPAAPIPEDQPMEGSAPKPAS